MLLIVRAQNQASGALRRVGKDLSALGKHRNLQIQQQKMLLKQQTLMRQGLRARNELADITSGSRRIALERRALQLQKQAADIERKRSTALRNWGNISRQIGLQQDRLNKISNDQFRRETQRLRLYARQARAMKAEEALVKSRRTMLREGGGLAKMKGSEADLGSKAGIADARARLTLLDRMLTANSMRQEELAANAKNTNRAINQQIAAGGALGEKYRSTNLEAAKLAKAQQGLASDHIKLANRAHILRSELAGVATQYAMAQQQQRALSKEIRAARFEPISTLGRTVQHLGRVGQYAFLVFGGGLAYAAHQAAMFEKNVTLVATQTGKVDENFGRTTKTIVSNSKYLQRAFIDIQASGTSSMDDINAAAYNLFSTIDQLGDSRKGLGQGTKMLRLFSDAAIAGSTPITDVAEGVIGVLSAFDNIAPTAANVERILNRMFAAVRFGRMSFAELNESLTTLTPAAKAAGQTLDTTLGTFAFLSKPLGVAKARVGIPRLMEVLTRPKMVEGLKKLGIEVADSSGRMFQLDKIIGNIVRKRPDITKSDLALMQFFKTVGNAEGTVMARRAFVFLARNLTGYQRILRKVTTDNNEFKRSLKTMEETTGVRWEKFINQLRAIALMIGANVLPEILKLAPHIQKLVDWFQDLDPALRANIVHIAAITVGIVGLASAAMFLLGPLIRIAAALAKARLLFVALGVGFFAVSAAIAMLTGEWDGLNTIIEAFFGLTDQGKWGWIAMFAIATAGALKLSRAILAVRNAYVMASVAQAAGTGAAGLGGLAGMFARGQGATKTLKAIGPATAGASKLQKTLFLASSAALAIPGPLWVAGAAIAAAAGGAYLWKRHMDGVKKAAQETKNITLQMEAPQRAAARFGGTGAALIDFKQAQLDAQRVKKTIADLQRQLKTAKGGERSEIQLQLNQAFIDRARVLANLTTTYNNLRVATGGFSDYLARQRIALAQLGTAQLKHAELLQRRKVLEQQLAATPPRGRGLVAAELDRLNQKIAASERQIKSWATEVNRGSLTAQTSFNKVITVLQNMNMLPKNITADMRRMAMDFQRQTGKLMTPDQLNKFFKIALNLDTGAANTKMRTFIGKWRAEKIKLSADIKIAAGKANQLTNAEILSQGKGPLKKGVLNIPTKLSKPKLAPGWMGGLKIPPIIPKAKPGPARTTIENAFKSPIKQSITVSIPNMGILASLGASIASGVAAGIYSSDAVSNAMAAIVARARAAGGEAAGEGSPAKLFIPLGQSMIDGIIKGLLQKEKIEKTASLVMDLFNGAFLQKKNQKIEAIGDTGVFSQLKLDKYLQQQKDALAKFKKSKKQIDKIRADEFGEKAAKMRLRKGLSFGDLLKDAKGQVRDMLAFNKSLDQLKRKGAPRGLLDDLRELGIDGLKYIKLLATASPAEFKKYIRAWNQMQGQIRRSQIESLEDIKNWKQNTLDQLKDFKETAANKLLDTWNELHDIAENNMGPLFQGLENKIGEGFKSATEEWQTQVDDYRSQIEDLQGQIREVHDSMQQALGQLFAGEFLQNDPGVASKKEWGVALGFDDLFQDLKGQVGRFKDWQSTLTSLAGKLPADLAAQLKELGPEALDSLKILDNATAEQIAEYVKLWREGQDAVGQATLNATKELAANIVSLTDVLNNLLNQAPKALTGADVISGLRTQIAGFDTFEKVLDDLRKRGLPEEIIKQLAQMGPEGLPYMNALNSMTQTELNQYVSLWKTAQEKVNTATNKLMQDQLDIWYRHGANVASAIIAGVASEQQALLNFFGNLFQNLLEGKMPNMPGVTPGSPLPSGAVPIGGMGGAGGGQFYRLPDGTIIDSNGKVISSGTGGSGGGAASQPMAMTSTTAASVPASTTTIQIGPVHAVQSESLEQVLSRAAFNVRNTFAE